MAFDPIPPRRPPAPRRAPTALEHVRADYIAGRIDAEELDRRVESLVRSGSGTHGSCSRPGGLPAARGRPA